MSNCRLTTRLSVLRPQKDALVIRKAMGGLRLRLDETKEEKRKTPRAPRFAPAGQSTQMIIGADEANDRDIIARSASLYASYGLRRVYYSAFSPIPSASQSLPLRRPPLMREHRLYQADWLMRYYGFAAEEIVDGASDGMLDLERDPKLAWALRNRALFPIDVNRAPRETLLRVPGLGARVVKRILTARRHVTLRIDDLARLVRSLDAVRPFVVTPDWRPTGLIDSASLAASLRVAARVSSIFLHEFGQGAVKIVSLESEIDFEGFRRVARAAAASGVRPDAIRFVTGNAEEESDLFSSRRRLSSRRQARRCACLPVFSTWPIWFADIRSRPATICFTQPSSDFGRRRASWRSPAIRWCDGLRTWSARCGAIGTR